MGWILVSIALKKWRSFCNWKIKYFEPFNLPILANAAKRIQTEILSGVKTSSKFKFTTSNLVVVSFSEQCTSSLGARGVSVWRASPEVPGRALIKSMTTAKTGRDRLLLVLMVVVSFLFLVSRYSHSFISFVLKPYDPFTSFRSLKLHCLASFWSEGL